MVIMVEVCVMSGESERSQSSANWKEMGRGKSVRLEAEEGRNEIRKNDNEKIQE